LSQIQSLLKNVSALLCWLFMLTKKLSVQCNAPNCLMKLGPITPNPGFVTHLRGSLICAETLSVLSLAFLLWCHFIPITRTEKLPEEEELRKTLTLWAESVLVRLTASLQ